MARTTNVALANKCMASVYPAGHTDNNPLPPIGGMLDKPGNMQMDSRELTEEYFEARGINKQVAFRIRIDLPEDGTIPKIGSKVFISECPRAPQLRGWWNVWDDPTIGTGSLPTMRLYIVKPYKND